MSDVATERRGFEGLRVVSFESRREQEMARLIREQGGLPLVAPSMREVPFERNEQALLFGQKLLQGAVDVIIFLTGAGTEALFEILERQLSPTDLIEALRRKRLIARGPKPQAVLRAKGLSAEAVQEPATWREVVATVDSGGSVQGRLIALQEYGASNADLVDALSARGARILKIPVYRWALPENREPLKQALRAVIDGEADVVLFTNAHQISHVLQLAQEEGLEKQFRAALAKTVVASVGPMCSRFLDEYGLPVDLEPEKPRMGELVLEASQKGAGLLERKRRCRIERHP